MSSPLGLSPQEQILSEKEERNSPLAVADGGDLTPSIDLGARQLKRQQLDSLFSRAMAGLIPRARALDYWEPEVLDERHLHAVLLRAGGMKQKTIAKFLDWTEAWTSVVLNHPDAQYVLTRIVSFAADNVIDMQTRIKATAPEAFDRVVEIMRASQDEKLVSQNAFEILRMAGYGAKPGTAAVSVNNNIQLNQISAPAFDNLANAIRESREIVPHQYGALPVAQAVPVEQTVIPGSSLADTASSDALLERELLLIDRDEAAA